MDGKRHQAPETQHADRGVRAHTTLDDLPGMGLGHRRQRTSTGLLEEVRVRHRAEWTHSPDDAEGRRKRDFSYRDVNGVPATAARQGGLSRTDEGPGRATEERT